MEERVIYAYHLKLKKLLRKKIRIHLVLESAIGMRKFSVQLGMETRAFRKTAADFFRSDKIT